MKLQYPIRLHTVFLISSICLFFTSTGLTQQEQLEPSVEGSIVIEQAPEAQKLQTTRDRLASISDSIKEKQQQLGVLEKKLRSAKNETEQKDIQSQIDEVEKAVKSAEHSFESIAAGGVDLQTFSDSPMKKFDWRGDLSEILKPIFEGLKGLTEKPRTIEKLRSAIEFYKNQLRIIEDSLVRMQLLQAESFEKAVLGRLSEVERTWLQRKVNIERELNVTEYQLQNILEQETSFWISLKTGFSNFITGRGLTLLVAIAVAAAVWFALKGVLKAIWGRKNIDEARIRGAYSRVFIYGYRVLSVFLTLMALLLVLYFSGDWLLLGLSLLLLAGFAIGFKTYFFKFLNEAKLILNLGPVREGERVIYDGIPWRVRSLNFYSLLVNPCLNGGMLRLPISALATRISRPYQKEEIWFPSDVGDFVLLSDGTFGQVTQQTPEVVRLKVLGAGRTFSVSDYLGLSPRNLSQGSYGFSVIFGIDYQHQTICLDEVAPILKEAVKQAIAESSTGEHLEDLIVDFKEAGASSLDYLVHVVMNGKAASAYWSLQRVVQQACVKACNQQSWGIPFSQLTIHKGEGFNSL